MQFPHLFSPLTVGTLEIKNRIFSTGHQTNMVQGGLPTDRMVAYQEAKAAGGAGLVILEAARMHETAAGPGHILDLRSDDAITAFRTLADAVKRHDCRIFGQLAHPGLASLRFRQDIRQPVYSASAVRDHRFKNVSRPLGRDQIAAIADGYGAGAERLVKAGFHGVEVTASHGMLPAQFLNPRLNRRDDDYGGSLENRARFLSEVLAAIRRRVPDGFVLCLRISLDEKEQDGLTPPEAIEACRSLEAGGNVDVFNVIAGSMAGLAGSIHVVPPMWIETGYVAPDARALKDLLRCPVFVAGRINQPQIAEQILAEGQADMCGMTRAIIADPQMPHKARTGAQEDICACIGCNQACIGHLHSGLAISCIQNPATGRELEVPAAAPQHGRKRILIAGGGPAGLKAAATAAERGHEVLLYEATEQLGGQAQLAQSLPGRAEFGGLITNLVGEVRRSGVSVQTNRAVDRALVAEVAPDAIIVATGARPYWPDPDTFEDAQVVDAWQVLAGGANVGSRVVVADWRGDWIGLGLAEKLARDGCAVHLAVAGPMAGEALQSYTRDHWIGLLHRVGVRMTPYAVLFGADRDTVYCRHAVTGEAIEFAETDTLVLSYGHSPETRLETDLAGLDLPRHVVGDCLSPRSAEEAVYEGWAAALSL